MFDDIIDDMLNEELEGISRRSRSCYGSKSISRRHSKTQVERLGRMVNEDIPAIADPMVSEFGAQKAQHLKNKQTLKIFTSGT